MERICANCGSPLEDDSVFCPNCGRPVEAPKAEPAPAAPAAPAAAPVYTEPVRPAAAAQPAPAPAADAASKPLGTGSFFWLMFLYAIPVIGFIVMLIMAFAAKNKNRRNFARAILIWILIGVILSLVFLIIYWIVGKNMGATDIGDFLRMLFESLNLPWLQNLVG